jgi:uncharacterized membrane protein YtjA (UPF0391 family)
MSLHIDPDRRRAKPRRRRLANGLTAAGRKEHLMLRWALIFLVIALIAALFGFGGIAAGAAGIAKILFFVFLVIFILSLISHFARRA